MEDLTGRRFGKLTVVSFGERIGARYYWKCRCDCGREKLIDRRNFTSGLSKSCGLCSNSKFFIEDGYAVGITHNGTKFIFDIEDLESVSMHSWNVYNRKYISTKINGFAIPLHRYVLGNPKKVFIDHRDRNPLNCRKENLRTCNQAENNRNVGVSKNNKSGYKGVCWTKRYKKWLASITVNSKFKYIGTFNTPEEAAKAYNQAASFYYGEFAYLNDV